MDRSLAPLQCFLKKALSKRLLKSAGRNFLGRICVFHRGGGSLFNSYRVVDYSRRVNLFGRVVRLGSVFYRSAFIATVLYVNGLVSNIVAVEGLILGSIVYSGSFFPKHSAQKLSLGSTLALQNTNLFSVISSSELGEAKGLKLFRSAGVSAVFVAKDKRYGTLKCPSGWLLKTSLRSLITLGRTSNIGHRHQRIPNAGYNRRRGIRPTVRGVVKNPCDHPHGGGEGKGSPPAAAKTPWAKLTKGTPTTKKRWAVLRRRFFKKF